jgi:hypothetical protein
VNALFARSSGERSSSAWRRPVQRSLLLCTCALCASCAHAPPDPWSQRPPYLGDERVLAQHSQAFAPSAEERSQVSAGRVALRTSGAEEQARATALRFAGALLAGDAATLSELLPTRVALTIDGSLKPRDELIERCLKDARALIYATEHDPATVLDLTAMRVERADAHHASSPLPIGIDAADLSVTLPLRDADDENQHRIPCMTTLYIRTGQRDLVVGIAK